MLGRILNAVSAAAAAIAKAVDDDGRIDAEEALTILTTVLFSLKSNA